MKVKIEGKCVGKVDGDLAIRQGDWEVYMIPWGVSEDAEKHLEQLLDKEVFLACEVLSGGKSGVVVDAYTQLKVTNEMLKGQC